MSGQSLVRDYLLVWLKLQLDGRMTRKKGVDHLRVGCSFKQVVKWPKEEKACRPEYQIAAMWNELV